MICLRIHLFKPPSFKADTIYLSLIDTVSFIKIIYCLLMLHSFKQETFCCKKEKSTSLIKKYSVISTKAGIYIHFPNRLSHRMSPYFPPLPPVYILAFPCTRDLFSVPHPFCPWIICCCHFNS